MIEFAICDDEPQMAQELARRLARYMDEKRPGAYRVSSFSGGSALLAAGRAFDVIFLDIRMEPPDGLQTAQRLRRQNARSLLIFVTVLEECVFDAFEVSACGYLLKPVEDARFARTMDRVLHTLDERAAKTITLRRGACCEVIPLEQLAYCEVQGRKLYLHRADGRVSEYYGRLEALAQQLDGRFFRCHRSYLVNLEQVRGSGAGQVTLAQGEAVPLSRLRRQELGEALLRFMKEKEG